MEKPTRHHIIFTRRSIHALGGEATLLRGYRSMVPLMIDSVHGELHSNIQPVPLRPLEHARAAFRGVGDLGLEDLTTLQAMDRVAMHFGRVSLNTRLSLPTQRVAQNMEENILKQRPYVTDGIV